MRERQPLQGERAPDMTDYRFAKVYRLLKTDEYSSVFNLRRCYSHELFQIYSKGNELGHARLGLVMAKKVAKAAVTRNTMKRIVREWFRLHRPDLLPFDLVIRARRPFGRAQTRAAWQQLDTLIARMGACRAYSSP